MAAAGVVDLAPAREIIGRFAGQRGALITVLQAVQEAYGYLPEGALVEVAAGLGVSQSQVYGVATFYAQFYLTRRGRHVVRTCDGTACHVRGSAKIIDAVRRELGVGPGETTPDYAFTYEVVYCLGSCGLSPVAVVDGRVIGRLTPEKLTQIVRELRAEQPAPAHRPAAATRDRSAAAARDRSAAAAREVSLTAVGATPAPSGTGRLLPPGS